MHKITILIKRHKILHIPRLRDKYTLGNFLEDHVHSREVDVQVAEDFSKE